MEDKIQIAVEEVKKPTRGNRNRTAGHILERKVAIKMREIGFPDAVTSRSESKRRDDAKVDIMNKDEAINGRMIWNIQCKNCATSLPYPKVMSEMPKVGKEHNVIIHNQTERTESGTRFMTKGQFAIMNLDSFYQMAEALVVLEKGYNILNDYFEHIPEEDQALINRQLDALGL